MTVPLEIHNTTHRKSIQTHVRIAVLESRIVDEVQGCQWPLS